MGGAQIQKQKSLKSLYPQKLYYLHIKGVWLFPFNYSVAYHNATVHQVLSFINTEIIIQIAK